MLQLTAGVEVPFCCFGRESLLFKAASRDVCVQDVLLAEPCWLPSAGEALGALVGHGAVVSNPMDTLGSRAGEGGRDGKCLWCVQ